ncbi:hypothetical protein HY631_00495 [Candidatus Uhrbacteria bacterium]|nr:hypothetical protein [Candidatus Uhrbacteria bacterium]
MTLSKEDLEALGHNVSRKTPEGRLLLRCVHEDPVTALKLIGSTALKLAHEALALDNIIGAIGDDEEAKSLIAQHVTREVQAEILGAWGDRVSALSAIADAETLVSAIGALYASEAAGAEGNLSVAAAVIRSLALQIHDRPDWEAVLEHEFANGYTIGDLLIVAVAAEVEPIDENGTRSPDVWARVGLDPDDAQDRLDDLPDDLLNEVTETSLFVARAALSRTREDHGLPSATRGSAQDV